MQWTWKTVFKTAFITYFETTNSRPVELAFKYHKQQRNRVGGREGGEACYLSSEVISSCRYLGCHFRWRFVYGVIVLPRGNPGLFSLWDVCRFC